MTGEISKSRVTGLVKEIKRLEAELERAIDTREEQLFDRLDGSRVHFEAALTQAQSKLKQGVLQWLKESELRNILSAPIIYAMIVPFVLLDIAISIYQLACFPLYRIPVVKRSTYFVFDRHRLAYLNIIEKTHCLYCGYINGLVSYSKEIVGRTEQYWCPLKHARRLVDAHRYYSEFAAYGDAQEYPEHTKSMRVALRKIVDD